jgi:hypothetical protein
MSAPSEARGETPEARSARNSEAKDGRKGMSSGAMPWDDTAAPPQSGQTKKTKKGAR